MMKITYTTKDGSPVEVELKQQSITMGRSPDADIVVLDERSSRMHCGIRYWEEAYYIKDLQSRNGTYVNGEKVEMVKIKPGDKIRLGKSIFNVSGEAEDGRPSGTDTITETNNVQNEMSQGKGYKTILREIVADVGPDGKEAVVSDKPVDPDKTEVREEPVKKQATKPAPVRAEEINTTMKVNIETEPVKADDAEEAPIGIVEVDESPDAAKATTMAIDLSGADEKAKPAADPIKLDGGDAGDKPKPKPKLSLGLKDSGVVGKTTQKTTKLKTIKRPSQIKLKKPSQS